MEVQAVALQLLEQMRALGIAPTAVTYGAVISACQMGRRSEEAVELLRVASAEGLCNTVTYGAAISACSEAGQWKKSLALLEEMEGAGIKKNTIVYNAAVQACQRGGAWEEAVQLGLGKKKQDKNPLAWLASLPVNQQHYF